MYVAFKEPVLTDLVQSNLFKVRLLFGTCSANRPLNDPFPCVRGLVPEWVQNYAKSFVSAQELQTEVDEFMKVYDEKKEAEERLAKEKEGVPDDEGWVTVSRQ